MTLFSNVDADPDPNDGKRSDAEIRQDIQALYSRNPYLRDRNIEINVDKGQVTLRGVVFTQQSWELAQDIAADINGVSEIHNPIKIQPGPGYPD